MCSVTTDFLQSGVLPVDKKLALRITLSVSEYIMVDGVL